MKVQTWGLLVDLSTMKPPGPFSPLRREVQLGDLGTRQGPWLPTLFLAHLGLGWKTEGSC